MENLLHKSDKKIRNVPLKFERSLINEINWKDRLIGIRGARGTGKTTLLLQYLQKKLQGKSNALYVSLDDLYFAENRLYDLAVKFIQYDGTHLFLDEVHRYPEWSAEIKLIYDDYPELNIVFTGSSMLNIVNAKADLSRRAMFYDLQGLSFREFLNFSEGFEFQKIKLDELIENHHEIATDITTQLKILPLFKKYLKEGYYPFFKEYPENYLIRLMEIINMIIEVDIPSQRNIQREAIPRIKKLLYIISNSVPFKPNVQKLSELMGISRNSVVTYVNYLQEAAVLNLLFTETIGIGYLRKPEKIFLENTNLNYALGGKPPQTGNLRETFFFNQLKKNHRITAGKHADFVINETYVFEIGGKSKKAKQIAGLSDAFTVHDEIETGFGNKIPLWLFGFLY